MKVVPFAEEKAARHAAHSVELLEIETPIHDCYHMVGIVTDLVAQCDESDKEAVARAQWATFKLCDMVRGLEKQYRETPVC